MKTVVPSLPSVGGPTNVVVVSAQEETLPVKEKWRETVWLTNSRRNLDVGVLISANVQILATMQRLVDKLHLCL